MTKIFKIYNSGIKTDRDSLFIDKEMNKLEKRIKTLFSGNYDKGFKNKYNVKDSGSYNLIERITKKEFEENKINKIHYRPFDIQNIYYQVGLTSRPSNTVHNNIINKNNILLIFPRMWSSAKKWTGCFITDIPVDIHLIGGQSNIAPLYIYNTNGNSDQNGNDYLFKDQQKKDNFSKEFHKFLKENKLKDYSPEQILGYIYAILFSPTYREKYFEFLKIDFPRIPFTKDRALFEKLSGLGTELIENHLLKRVYQKNEMPVFAVEGNNEVKQITYSDDLQRLYINKTQYFENFPKSVWDYEIGGYMVFDKYLKARKDMELSYNEINHIKKVAASISKTIEIQQNIDNLCAMWV